MKLSPRILFHRLLTYPPLLPIMSLYRLFRNKKPVLDAFYFLRGLPHGFLRGNLRIALFEGYKIVFPFNEDPFFDDIWLRDVYYPYNPSKNDLVFDIGAHMGFFTIKIARRVKKKSLQ